MMTFEKARYYCLNGESENDKFEYVIAYSRDGTERFRGTLEISRSIDFEDLLQPGDTLVFNDRAPCTGLRMTSAVLANVYGIEVIAVCSDGGVYSVDFTNERLEEQVLLDRLSAVRKGTIEVLHKAVEIGVSVSDADLLMDFYTFEEAASEYFLVFAYTIGATVLEAHSRVISLHSEKIAGKAKDDIKNLKN